MKFDRAFSAFANRTAKLSGSPGAFALCAMLVVGWAASGPAFHYSETWQLVINTGTTIITFLMVFLIQNTQNRDGMAIQAKLDELILTSEADNEFIGIEKLTDSQLQALQNRCARAARLHDRLSEKIAAEVTARRSQAKPPAPSAAAKPARAARPPRARARR